MTTPTPTPAEQFRADMLRALADLRADLTAELESMRAELAQIRSGLATASQPAPAPAVGPSETMLAETLIYSIDDNGKPAYKLRGGRYSKNGVRVWPEVLKTIIEDLTKLQPGPTAINPPVLVAVELATRPGRADLGEDPAQQVQYARKVTGKA